jgi:LPS export ABC transporter protein LptC
MRFYRLLFPVVLFLAACSFDYGDGSDAYGGRPDIVMENIEYVRVRGGEPLVRFRAEHAERWEDSQMMELRDFTFEHLENSGEEVNAEGRAGSAAVQLDTGNVTLRDGVLINIESEDIIIRTSRLEWRDRERLLLGAAEADVNVERSDGTNFTGRGFSADIRNRTWAFTGEVSGTYVETEDEEADEPATLEILSPNEE